MEPKPLQITSQLIMAAARQRGWQVEIIYNQLGVVRYTDLNGTAHMVRSVLTTQTNAWHLLVAKRKDLLYQLAADWQVPIPATEIYNDLPQGRRFLEKYGQIVVKPHAGGHGAGITSAIIQAKQIPPAIHAARSISSTALLQQHITGVDYRLLYIGNEFVAAAIRHPAQVTGDGRRTVRELIAEENKRPERSPGYHTALSTIDLMAAERFLGKSIEAVVPSGEMIVVVGTANIGTGGTAEDASETVPPAMKQLAQTVIQQLHLPLAGIDFLYNPQTGPVLIEINTCPSFGLHAFPHIGRPRPVAERFLDWLETIDEN